MHPLPVPAPPPPALACARLPATWGWALPVGTYRLLGLSISLPGSTGLGNHGTHKGAGPFPIRAMAQGSVLGSGRAARQGLGASAVAVHLPGAAWLSTACGALFGFTASSVPRAHHLSLGGCAVCVGRASVLSLHSAPHAFPGTWAGPPEVAARLHLNSPALTTPPLGGAGPPDASWVGAASCGQKFWGDLHAAERWSPNHLTAHTFLPEHMVSPHP